jgi:hypothetical protein
MRRERGVVDLDRHELASVVGGRGVNQSHEMDPALMQAMQGLVKALASIGDARKSAAKQNQQQVMSFMMHALEGGGDKKKSEKKK